MARSRAQNGHTTERSNGVALAPGDEAQRGMPDTSEAICRRCLGTGRIAATRCRACAGTGKVAGTIGKA